MLYRDDDSIYKKHGNKKECTQKVCEDVMWVWFRRNKDTVHIPNIIGVAHGEAARQLPHSDLHSLIVTFQVLQGLPHEVFLLNCHLSVCC